MLDAVNKKFLFNTRSLIVMVCIAILLVLAAGSVRGMLADIIAYRAMLQERFWASGEPIESLVTWQRVNNQVDTALALSPGNTDYHLFRGRMAGWRLFVNDDTEQNLSEIFSKSDEAFRIALASRPYWAQGWSEFALFKSQLGEVDDEFQFALFAGIYSGPFETRAILNNLNASFAVWEQLSPNMKREAVMLFDLAVSLNYRNLKKRAMAMVQHYERLAAVCDSEALPEATAELCTEKKLRISLN